MRKVDLKYKSENLKEWELKSLSDKNESEKLSIKMILSISLFLTGLILIIPYFPPIKPGREFNPPENISEYVEEVYLTAIVLFLIFFLIFTIDLLRNKIDEKWKIKKVGDFEIKGKINFGNYTFILMNNLKFLFLKSNYIGLKSAKNGQVINVKKTVTNKIIDIYIRDKSKFEIEKHDY